MKKFTFGILIAASMAFAPAAYAEDDAYCFNVKDSSCDGGAYPHPFRHSCSNTGTHGIGDDRYYRDSGYTTRCRSASEGDVIGWASHCAHRYNKFFTGYEQEHPVGNCWPAPHW